MPRRDDALSLHAFRRQAKRCKWRNIGRLSPSAQAARLALCG